MNEFAGHLEEKREPKGFFQKLRDIAGTAAIGIELASFEGLGVSPETARKLREAALREEEAAAIEARSFDGGVPAELPPDVEVRLQNPGLFDD